MFVFELEARHAGRDRNDGFAVRILQLLARRKRPAPLPHDYREIEKAKLAFEIRKAEAMVMNRFRIM